MESHFQIKCEVGIVGGGAEGEPRSPTLWWVLTLVSFGIKVPYVCWWDLKGDNVTTATSLICWGPVSRADYFPDLQKWETLLFFAVHIRSETGAAIYVYIYMCVFFIYIYICKVFMKVIFLLMAFPCSITVNFWHRGCYSKRSALSDSYLLKSRLTFAICFAVLPLAPK